MKSRLVFLICFGVVAFVARGEAPLTKEQRAQIDEIVTRVLKETGAPGACVAVLKDGAIAMEKAYGLGCAAPPKAATTAMRFSIGSVSKQFTAAAVLLLAEEHKLALDDKVAKWLPQLTRADEVSIRQLLSMTAGYQDYYPQDYVFPAMREATTPMAILDRWARKPLDFDPGTKWQYSNTNYVIAGLIVEKAGGMPLFEFLKQRVFVPLKMASVRDGDGQATGEDDAAGHLRNALGPVRPAVKEGKGWLFAAGQLTMTAHDLALWDISVIGQTLMQPASYREQQTDTHLTNGVSTRYGLGVKVSAVDGRRLVAHNGAVSGFLTTNRIYPEERSAIVVFVNVYPGAASPEAKIADGIARVVFAKADEESAKATERARQVFSKLQQGKLDRAGFTANANAYFTDEVLGDCAASLGPLGKPENFTSTSQSLRGGLVLRSFDVSFEARKLSIRMQSTPEGMIEQFMIEQSE